MKKIRLIPYVLGVGCVAFFGGCVANITQPEKVNVDEKRQYKMVDVPSETILSTKNVSLYKNIKLSEALNQLEKIENHVYILDKDSLDIDLLSSNFQGVKSFNSLQKYIVDTSNGMYDIAIKNKYLDKAYSVVYCFDKFEKNKVGLEHIAYSFNFKEKIDLKSVFSLIEGHTGFNVVPLDSYIAKRLNEKVHSNYMGTNIKGFLDYLSRANNFFYEIDYVKKQIRVQQYKMGTFELAYQNEDVSLESTIDISSNAGSQSADKIAFTAKQSVFKNLKTSLESIFKKTSIDGVGFNASVEGSSESSLNQIEKFNIASYESFSINDTAGNVIINASPNTYEKAQQAIEDFNDIYGKNVVIDVNVYKVVYSKKNQYGTNFSILSELTKSEGLNLNLLGSLEGVANTALNAQSSVSFIDVTSDRTFTSVIQSLHNLGNSEMSNSFSIVTQNNILGVDFGRTQKTYVDKVESDTTEATVTTGEKTKYNASQKDLQYGDLLLVTPRVVEGNRIQLNMYLKFNTLNKLEEKSFGDISSNLFLQQPELDDSIKKLNLTIGAGERYLVSGKVKTISAKDYGGLLPTENGLVQSVTGSNNREELREEYIIMVSARIK